MNVLAKLDSKSTHVKLRTIHRCVKRIANNVIPSSDVCLCVAEMQASLKVATTTQISIHMRYYKKLIKYLSKIDCIESAICVLGLLPSTLRLIQASVDEDKIRELVDLLLRDVRPQLVTALFSNVSQIYTTSDQVENLVGLIYKKMKEMYHQDTYQSCDVIGIIKLAVKYLHQFKCVACIALVIEIMPVVPIESREHAFRILQITISDDVALMVFKWLSSEETCLTAWDYIILVLIPTNSARLRRKVIAFRMCRMTEGELAKLVCEIVGIAGLDTIIEQVVDQALSMACSSLPCAYAARLLLVEVFAQYHTVRRQIIERVRDKVMSENEVVQRPMCAALRSLTEAYGDILAEFHHLFVDCLEYLFGSTVEVGKHLLHALFPIAVANAEFYVILAGVVRNLKLTTGESREIGLYGYELYISYFLQGVLPWDGAVATEALNAFNDELSTKASASLFGVVQHLIHDPATKAAILHSDTHTKFLPCNPNSPSSVLTHEGRELIHSPSLSASQTFSIQDPSTLPSLQPQKWISGPESQLVSPPTSKLPVISSTQLSPIRPLASPYSALEHIHAMFVLRLARYFVSDPRERHPVLCLKSCFECDCGVASNNRCASVRSCEDFAELFRTCTDLHSALRLGGGTGDIEIEVGGDTTVISVQLLLKGMVNRLRTLPQALLFLGLSAPQEDSKRSITKSKVCGNTHLGRLSSHTLHAISSSDKILVIYGIHLLIVDCLCQRDKDFKLLESPPTARGIALAIENFEVYTQLLVLTSTSPEGESSYISWPTLMTLLKTLVSHHKPPASQPTTKSDSILHPATHQRAIQVHTPAPPPPSNSYSTIPPISYVAATKATEILKHHIEKRAIQNSDVHAVLQELLQIFRDCTSVEPDTPIFNFRSALLRSINVLIPISFALQQSPNANALTASLFNLLTLFHASLRKSFEDGVPVGLVYQHMYLIHRVCRKLVRTRSHSSTVAEVCVTLRSLMRDYHITHRTVLCAFVSFLLTFEDNVIHTYEEVFASVLRNKFEKKLVEVHKQTLEVDPFLSSTEATHDEPQMDNFIPRESTRSADLVKCIGIAISDSVAKAIIACTLRNFAVQLRRPRFTWGEMIQILKITLTLLLLATGRLLKESTDPLFHCVGLSLYACAYLWRAVRLQTKGITKLKSATNLEILAKISVYFGCPLPSLRQILNLVRRIALASQYYYDQNGIRRALVAGGFVKLRHELRTLVSQIDRRNNDIVAKVYGGIPMFSTREADRLEKELQAAADGLSERESNHSDDEGSIDIGTDSEASEDEDYGYLEDELSGWIVDSDEEGASKNNKRKREDLRQFQNTATPRQHRQKARSSNAFIDRFLQMDEPLGTLDGYVDLEDFIV